MLDTILALFFCSLSLSTVCCSFAMCMCVICTFVFFYFFRFNWSHSISFDRCFFYQEECYTNSALMRILKMASAAEAAAATNQPTVHSSVQFSSIFSRDKNPSKSNLQMCKTATHNTSTHLLHNEWKKIPEINSKQEFYLYIN